MRTNDYYYLTCMDLNRKNVAFYLFFKWFFLVILFTNMFYSRMEAGTPSKEPINLHIEHSYMQLIKLKFKTIFKIKICLLFTFGERFT